MPQQFKVLKLQVLKPVGGTAWQDLAKLLRDVRYRVFRLANLAMSEAYLNFHLRRIGKSSDFQVRSPGKLNRELREILARENESTKALSAQLSTTGALPDTVCSALWQYKLRGLISASNWKKVIAGKASLPTFRSNMAIPIRCDKPKQRRLEQTADGNVELDLMITRQPYPRVMLKTAELEGSPRAVLTRLLDNGEQSPTGYRQRYFEIKHEESKNRWWLLVCYETPQHAAKELSKEIIVGVDLGYSCPLYAAINNGHARLGWNQFAGLAARVRSLQNQVQVRRRNMLRGGKAAISADTARSGHGRKRKIRSIQRLEGKINQAYTTLNHQLSASLIKFAKDHGAGIIQIEDLEGLREELSGTFLGERWRYHQLQEFISYKAKEAGVEVRKVNPRFTSRRCSKCGYIHVAFSRWYRDASKPAGTTTKFNCPECGYEADADYNAARNLALLDIEQIIREKCRAQGLEYAG